MTHRAGPQHIVEQWNDRWGEASDIQPLSDFLNKQHSTRHYFHASLHRFVALA
jgi:hypothetical protein